MPDAVCAVLSSWWWMEKPSETRRASYRNKQIEKSRKLLVVLWEHISDARTYEREIHENILVHITYNQKWLTCGFLCLLRHPICLYMFAACYWLNIWGISSPSDHRQLCNLLLLLLLLSWSLLSPSCRVFTIIYLKQTMFLGYLVLQLFHVYNLSSM